MPILWSRIHAALGLTPGELTYGMVSDAVAASVAETDDLDWKQALPAPVEKKQREFGKDVAAMANARGGLIVYGIEESGEHVVSIIGVPVGERDRQRLRALAFQHIRPLVTGLEVVPLTDGDEERGVLVVSVPSSADAPHVVGQLNEMGVPFRDGSDTRWMSEHQLERAYADRFARRDFRLNALTDMSDELLDRVEAGRGTWLVVAARPLAPLTSLVGDPARDDLELIFRDALHVANAIVPSGSSRSPILQRLEHGDITGPAVGLRRWVVRAGMTNRLGLSTSLHIELHHDGSSVVAADVASWLERGKADERAVPLRVAESAIVDAVAVITTHARRLGYDGQIAARLTLLRFDDRPFVALHNSSGGTGGEGMVPVTGARPVRRFTPVTLILPTTADPATLTDLAHRLALDTLHQFGVPRTVLLG